MDEAAPPGAAPDPGGPSAQGLLLQRDDPQNRGGCATPVVVRRRAIGTPSSATTGTTSDLSEGGARRTLSRLASPTFSDRRPSVRTITVRKRPQPAGAIHAPDRPRTGSGGRTRSAA